MHRVIGIDPGPTPGIAILNWLPAAGARGELDVHVLQCDHGIAAQLVDGLLFNVANKTTLIAVEKFVVGGRSGRVSDPKASAITRDLIGQLQRVADGRILRHRSVPITQRSAANVKPWASDRRLAELGLVDLTTGMRHARDACRHALFAAVHDLGLPDPLSRAGRGLPSLKGDS